MKKDANGELVYMYDPEKENEKIRREEYFVGEFDSGCVADSDEEDSKMEYFDWKIEAEDPIEEYQVYKWAKVDCDEYEDLAETQ